MFSVPNITVSNNTAFNGNLYPSHIYEWKFSGINCAAEDYTIGGTNTWSVSFKTDVKIDNSADLDVSGYAMKITQNARVNDSKNYYTVEAIPEKTFELDEFLDDTFIEYDQPETLSHLMNRIGWTTSGTGIPYDYVINSKWASQGMTKRQVVGNICQLLGANMVSWVGTSPTLFILNQAAPTAVPYGTSNVKSVTIADYRAPGINKIWFGTDGDDVGISYGTGAQDQQLTLPYNPLIDPDSQDNDSLLQYIYSKVYGNSYTPVKLTTFLDEAPTFNQLIGVATIPAISFTDENNSTYAFPIFNWEVSSSGCKLEATGNTDRSVSNQNLASEIAQNGKYNKFKRTLDATTSEIASLNGDVSTLQQTAASLTVQVASKVGDDEIISKINQTAETITINASKINLNGAVEVGPSDTQPEAFLTIVPSQADMSGQHSRVRLYNNSVYVNTYDINDNEICSNVQQGSLTGLYSKGEVNGVTYSYPNVLLMSHAGSEAHPSGSGYGHIMLYNSEWLRAHGITTTSDYKPSVTLSAGDTADASGWATFFNVDSNGQQKPRIELTSLNSGQIVLKDDNGYGVKLNSEARGVLLLKPTTTTYPYAYYENNKLQIYSSASTSTLVNPDGVTAYGSTTNKTALTKDGVLVYGDKGDGTPATKGRYTGDSLSVGVAASGTAYTSITPTVITWWNSGYNPVNYLVPQGASVVEHGTKTVGSQVWEYRKWSDKTYECWTKIPEASRVFEGWNQPCIVSKYSVGGLTYPVTFTEAPHEQVTPFGANSVMLIEDGTNNNTTTSRKYQGVRPRPDSGFISGTTAFSFGLDFYVKGTVS